MKAHLSVLLGRARPGQGGGYWLQRYELTSRPGASSTARPTPTSRRSCPRINLLILISLLAAVLLIVNIWRRGWVLPVIAVGLWAFVAIVAGTIYPAFVQRFQVQPAESPKERRTSRATSTRRATALEPRRTSTQPGLPGRHARRDASVQARPAGTSRNIRLLDPNIVGIDVPAAAGARAASTRSTTSTSTATRSTATNAAGRARGPRAEPGRHPAQHVGGPAPRLHPRLRRWPSRRPARSTVDGAPDFLRHRPSRRRRRRCSTQPDVYFGEDLERLRHRRHRARARSTTHSRTRRRHAPTRAPAA